MTHSFRLLYTINIKCRNPHPFLHNHPCSVTSSPQVCEISPDFPSCSPLSQCPLESHIVRSVVQPQLFYSLTKLLICMPQVSQTYIFSCHVVKETRWSLQRISAPYHLTSKRGITYAHRLFKSFRHFPHLGPRALLFFTKSPPMGHVYKYLLSLSEKKISSLKTHALWY